MQDGPFAAQDGGPLDLAGHAGGGVDLERAFRGFKGAVPIIYVLQGNV